MTTTTIKSIGKEPPSRNPGPVSQEETAQPEKHWKRDDTAARETWYFGERYSASHGYVSKYDAGDWNWQSVRNGHRTGGIEATHEAAMANAEAGLSMPIDEFNAIVSRELRDEIRAKEKQLIALDPTTELLTGYHAGFEAGFAKAREAMIAATEITQ